MKLSKREKDPIFQKKGGTSMEQILTDFVLFKMLYGTKFFKNHPWNTAESGNWDIPYSDN